MTFQLLETSQENTARVAEVVEPLARSSTGQVVFLVDGDQTLSAVDTSIAFLKLADVDPLVIKQRFQRDGYVFSAFRFHTQMHIQLGESAFDALAPLVAAKAALNPGARDFLAAAAKRGRVFVVTAGIPRIWRLILDREGLGDICVIGGIDPRTPFVFGRDEKAQVTTIFRRYARVLIGVGDSDVDSGMLCLADHAVVVVNHRRNVDLMPALEGHPSLWQVVPTGVPHQGLPELSFPGVASLAVTTTSKARSCP